MTTTQAGSRPARLLYIASWLLAIVFAFSLSWLGELLIRDMAFLPQGGPPDIGQFVDYSAVDPLRAQQVALRGEHDSVESQLSAANEQLERAQQAYSDAKEAFQHWVDTRKATGDSAQDSQVLERTHRLDLQLADITKQQNAIHALEDQKNAIDARIAPVIAKLDTLSQAAGERFGAAARHYALVVFAWRLCFTLPPVLIAVWLILRHRKSRYWPFVYGFALFALAGFFLELVPYLPSFGGYVRAVVATALTVFAGVTMLRAFQRYVERKRAELEQSQHERARHMSHEKAITAHTKHFCPSCDKPWTPGDTPMSYCVYCGLQLFVTCGCGTRNFAFFPYCSHCGKPVALESQPCSEA